MIKAGNLVYTILYEELWVLTASGVGSPNSILLV